MGTREIKIKNMKRIIAVFIFIVSICSIYAQSSYTCDHCSGTGKQTTRCTNRHCHNGAIYCTICDYRGTVERRCSSCAGNGIVNKEINKTCEYCKGARYTRMSKETPCSCRGGKRPQRDRNGRTIYVNCSRCNGSGTLTSYYNAACRPCAGKGYKSETSQVQCNSCNGMRVIKETCSRCKGKGCYPCETCGGYANITQTCERCRGGGKIYVKD